MNLLSAQCRAARALVGMTQDQLAKASEVSKRTIAHFEAGERTPTQANRTALMRALEAAGVEFIPGGARLREREAVAA